MSKNYQMIWVILLMLKLKIPQFPNLPLDNYLKNIWKIICNKTPCKLVEASEECLEWCLVWCLEWCLNNVWCNSNLWVNKTNLWTQWWELEEACLQWVYKEHKTLNSPMLNLNKMMMKMMMMNKMMINNTKIIHMEDIARLEELLDCRTIWVWV